ncbi:MAG: SDR family NAD(P)-dependent oxidoreductase [Synechococcaceae bacterium WB9_4xC_028]|nr:SDR family NAD(P)-dependent oxidoreductase [Synechococcaceae bacterium WB9_4xC_028]
MTRLLITGGAGFIGSHTCVVLLDAGHDLVVIDDFSNSSAEALERVADLADVTLGGKRLQLERGDIRDGTCLHQLFASAKERGAPIEAVIHFAGLKAVGESVAQPLRYWDVNVSGSRTLLSAMDAHGCRTLVFSSSATLYGYPEAVPIPETAPIQPINPYGHSKAAVERMLEDLAAEFGVSRERIRQIEVRAFEKLQKAVRDKAEELKLLPADSGEAALLGA